MKNLLILFLIAGLSSCQMDSSSMNKIDTSTTILDKDLDHHHEHDHKHDHPEEHHHGEMMKYDSLLAHELGADDYGMRQYVMAFLKAGPNRNQSKEEAQKMQVAHLENIQRLADEGTLVLAGPFMESPELRGIYVFDVATVEEAEKLTSSDPMIQSGRLVMEMHAWYGSAGLKKVNEIHNQIQNVNITAQ